MATREFNSESYEVLSLESCMQETTCPTYCHSDLRRAFKKLITNVAGCLSSEDARTILYTESLPGDGVKALDALDQLEKKGIFSCYNIEPLEELLKSINRCDIVTNYVEEFKQQYGSAVTQGIPPSRRQLTGSTTSTPSYSASLLATAPRRLSFQTSGSRPSPRTTEVHSALISEDTREGAPVSLPSGRLTTQQQTANSLKYFYTAPPEGPRQEPLLLTSSHPVQQSRQHSLQQYSYKLASQAQSVAIPVQFTQNSPQGLPAPRASLQSHEGYSTEAAVFPTEFSPMRSLSSMQHEMVLGTSELQQPPPTTTTGIQMPATSLRFPEASFATAQIHGSQPSPNGHNFPAMRFQVGEHHAFQPPGLPYASHLAQSDVLPSRTPPANCKPEDNVPPSQPSASCLDISQSGSTVTAVNSQGLGTQTQLPSHPVSPPQHQQHQPEHPIVAEQHRNVIASGVEDPVPAVQENTTQAQPQAIAMERVRTVTKTMNWIVKRETLCNIICKKKGRAYIKPSWPSRLKLRPPHCSQAVELGLKIYPHGLDEDEETHATLEVDMYPPAKWKKEVLDEVQVKLSVQVLDGKTRRDLTEGRDLSAESKLTSNESLKIHKLLDHSSIVHSHSVTLEAHVTAELYETNYRLREEEDLVIV